MPGLAAAPLLRELAARPAPASSARARLRAEALDLLANEDLAEPAVTFAIADLDAPPADTLSAGGERLYAPKLLPLSGELTGLACGVATVGARLEARAAALFAERRMSLALALDALANELLFAVSRRLQDRMLVAARKRGLMLAGELRPGDPGLAINAQGAVLRLAGAESIGVRVGAGHLLTPLKSVSVVFGAGIDLPPARWSRCDDCRSRPTCTLVAETEMVDA